MRQCVPLSSRDEKGDPSETEKKGEDRAGVGWLARIETRMKSEQRRKKERRWTAIVAGQGVLLYKMERQMMEGSVL